MGSVLGKLGVAAIALVFAVLGRVAAGALDLGGWQWWALQAVFWVLGLLLAWITHLFLRGRSRSGPLEESVPAAADLQATWAETERRLASAQGLETQRIGRLPLLLVVGPPNAAKTTSVLQSGLSPELLAGAAMEGDAVAPTRGLTTWFGGGWLVAEAAPDVFEDGERWGWTTRAARPDRLAAALAGARQAPRAVLLCFPCSQLADSGGGIRTLAQTFRTRLTELANTLGVQIPVYVLFTKLDQVSNFTDFTRHLGTDEARDILGATLPRGSARSGGPYDQTEAQIVGRAFDSIVHGLALRRTQLLLREPTPEIRVGGYEFPREFSKLRAALTDFIVELGRPSQVGLGAFVRGFYFTGVRPVVVDSGPSVRNPAASAPRPAAGATMVFDPHAGAPVAPSSGGSRRVPQWTFLPSLLTNVLFQDRAALTVTESGSRVSGLRRALLGTAIGLALALSTLFTVSFFSNRGLENRASRLVAAARVNAPDGAQLDVQSLAALDSLGEVLHTLRRYQDAGPPVRFRWGLYSGDDLMEPVRRTYFDRFASLMGIDALAALRSRLQVAVREQDPVHRQTTYDALKAYLMTHAEVERASESFLPEELLQHWGLTRELSPEVTALAETQFATYARELPRGEPLSVQPDSGLVELVRAYLADAAAEDRIYQAITASVDAPDARFTSTFGGQQVVRNAHVVAGAYTREGWDQVVEKLAGDLVSDEDWVTAAPVPPPDDIEVLRERLRARYVSDYVRRWREFLEAGAVEGFGDVDRAFQALEVVGDPGSPLLQMIAIASTQTGGESLDSAIVRAFSPAHAVVPPGGISATEAVTPYLLAVNNLATSLRLVSESTGEDRERERRTALSDARRATQAVSQMAGQLGGVPDAEPARRQIRRLFESPIQRAERVLGALPTEELNTAASSFCRELSSVTRLYPFNRSSTVEADPQAVAFAFGAESSVLWNFYENRLRGLVSEVGGRFRPASDASPRPNSEFVDFFDRAARTSRGLFPSGSGDIEIALRLAVPPPPGVEEVVVESGAQTLRFTDRDPSSKTLLWVPDPNGRVRIEVLIDGAYRTLVEETGTWSLFRVFGLAQWETLGRGAFGLNWQIGGLGVPLSGRVIFETGVDVLNPGLIGRLSCVPRVVR